MPSVQVHLLGRRGSGTSELAALLEVIDTLAVVASSHLLPEQARHHALHPLLTQDGILGRLELVVVVVVDALECRRDGGLLHAKLEGFGGRHGGQIAD